MASYFTGRAGPVSVALPVLICLALLLSGLAGTAAGGPPEYQVKAAFLLNTIRFVEWPAGENTSADIVIGVLGEDPFGPYLDELAGRKIKGRKIVIRHFSSPDRAAGCQVLFIPDSERRRLQSLLGLLRGYSILTVSDSDGFVHMGGMIEIDLDKGHLVFDVNQRQLSLRGLKISSQMLKLARDIVE